MKLKNKILTLIIMVFAICMMLVPNNVNAALQANGNTSTTATIGSWLLNIRKMEETGGTLGLTDTIDTTSLVSSATTSNNLDIHMEKNTEYGAMAILSASAYGNQNVIANGETTTGNKTGVYINLNREWVSAGKMEYDSVYINVNKKYKNLYESTYVSRVGDAIGETSGWHSSEASEWINRNDSSGLIRGFGGSIFSYYGKSDLPRNGYGEAYYTKPYSTRAVIVVGEGF